MRYNELNLKALREECGLDFAHYTYLRGMCSCCHGPKDLPARYWKNGKVSEKRAYDGCFDPNHEPNGEYTYILFKNACNGSGQVKSADEFKDIQNVEWGFPWKMMNKVCKALQFQVGDGYKVVKPDGPLRCITIVRANKYPEFMKAERKRRADRKRFVKKIQEGGVV